MENCMKTSTPELSMENMNTVPWSETRSLKIMNTYIRDFGLQKNIKRSCRLKSYSTSFSKVQP